MTEPTMSPTPDPPAKIEYDRLIAYFDKLLKITALLLGVVISAAAFFLWKNTEDLKSQAAASIKATQDSATREISDVGKTAPAEAQKAIDAAFEKSNVPRLIETTTQRKVDAAVEMAIQKDLGAKIDAFEKFVVEIGEINSHAAELIIEERAGLDYLLEKRDSSRDPAIRAYAASQIKYIGAMYEKRETTGIDVTLYERPDFFLLSNIASTPKQLMELIRHPGPAAAGSRTARAFMDMKKKVHWDVQTFDIPAAEKWCEAHKPICNE